MLGAMGQSQSVVHAGWADEAQVQVGTPRPSLSGAALKVVQMLCARADRRLAASRAGESMYVLAPGGRSSRLWLLGTSQGSLKLK